MWSGWAEKNSDSRDYICRGSDQLYNSCKESGDYICKGSFEDYSVQKRMILVKGHVFE